MINTTPYASTVMTMTIGEDFYLVNTFKFKGTTTYIVLKRFFNGIENLDEEVFRSEDHRDIADYFKDLQK